MGEELKSRSQIQRALSQNPGAVIKEIEELRSVLGEINALVVPGETDSVDSLLKMYRERDTLRAQLEKAEEVIRRNGSALEFARGSLASDQSVAFEVVDETLSLNETYFAKKEGNKNESA